ncbi:conserved exported protein of unknown function [Cupriavidus taiwanensis]|uniref:DUF1571 domain-containing protein n=2 Tax=Cupriavidus taiwanensis TaxID=164546 RepID=A0A7Z7J647_9BURK|nr:conserved hypothetical protein; putative exported protein [Cupriavidus taiwanensis]SOY99695.1 conserved hypothetical protein; putative exported protein [Cupriavidus taiwanensis]SOZ02744.1 conserved hypothetical protein; putative exported protein [Cupriavidus taiwanensis]SPC06111.1 conserved hypothetical protein; putative exported protein [Cupriavidus taiwanensis]SPD42530.1 conserved exported protein of unknown function [Cupriavidus taiwanensis]
MSIHPPIRPSNRPSNTLRRLAAVTGTIMGLLAAPLAYPPAAMAQPGSAAAASAAAATTGTAYDGLPSAQQAALFSRQVASGELARLSDAQVLAVFQALQPDALLKWARAEMNRYPEYEYWMSRQERLNGQWQEQPAKMQIRYRHAPRQLYAKWLPGGAQAGQEVLYDETRRKDEMYGHLGGVLGFTSMWIALDGSLARSQSNHTVRDLGFQYVLSMLERDAKSLRAAGLSEKYGKAEIVQEQGVRMVALTWDLPAGAPQYYAKRVQLMLDLKHPYIRVETAWDADGNMVEKIVFDKLVRKTFEAAAFDPANPEYRF